MKPQWKARGATERKKFVFPARFVRASMQGKLKRAGRRSSSNKIGKRGHAYEPTPEPSTRGVIDITQDVRLKLQILQSMLDHIADADDTD